MLPWGPNLVGATHTMMLKPREWLVPVEICSHSPRRQMQVTPQMMDEGGSSCEADGQLVKRN